jgi:hypothetical protein
MQGRVCMEAAHGAYGSVSRGGDALGSEARIGVDGVGDLADVDLMNSAATVT